MYIGPHIGVKSRNFVERGSTEVYCRELDDFLEFGVLSVNAKRSQKMDDVSVALEASQSFPTPNSF